MKKSTKIVFSVLIGFIITLNILAWKSPDFCDFYVDKIFPIWINTYGRLTSICKKSVGEIMIALAVILLLIAIVLGLVAVIFFIIRKINRRHINDIWAKRFHCYYKVVKGYYIYILGISISISLIMTLNCFILYHCSTFKDKYLMDMVQNREEYTVEELANLRDYVVMRVNEYAKIMERDENGLIVYDGNMEEEAIRSMKRLGETYPQLAGFYTTPKEIRTSEFLSQQYMQGYYFPFSMEANYNNVMYVMCKPSTMCHELAHTKGFIYEDEANFISFLACIQSDDMVFQYSGYLSVLNYIDNDFKESIKGDKNIYKSHIKISNQVKRDNVFLTKEAWAQVEKKAIVKTETVKKASNTFIETNLVLNGLEQGAANYSEVVGLLMDYYTCCDDTWREEENYLVFSELIIK